MCNAKLIVVIATLLATNAIYAEEGKISLGAFTGKIYKDGSGVFGLSEDVASYKDVWNIKIIQDKMSDKKYTNIFRSPFNNSESFGKIPLKSDISLLVELKDNKKSMCVYGHNFPGKTAKIRVGKTPPITTSENGCIEISQEMNTKLESESEVVLRGYHWPYEGGEDVTISLSGYKEVISILEKRDSEH